MRRGALQSLSLLILMLASLLAVPAFRSRVSHIATTATTGILKKTGLGNQLRNVVAGNHYLSHLAPLQSTAATATTSKSTSEIATAEKNHALPASSPPRILVSGQDRIPAPQSRQFSAMATPEAAPAAANPAAATPSPTDKTTEPELPKLSAADFREYNQLAEMMELYHNHFRHTWNMLYKTCTSGSRPNGMSLRSFLNQGLQLCRSLTMHHTIEEQYFFPPLAERMPAFAENDHLISQHELIHEGIVRLEEYLRACGGGERELRLSELQSVLDSFGTVLWAHLDDEVRMLGAENMRKFWSKEEIGALNIG